MTAVPIARSLIYSEVKAEHQHSNEKYGGVVHDDTHLQNDWIALVARYAGNAASYPACAKEWACG